MTTIIVMSGGPGAGKTTLSLSLFPVGKRLSIGDAARRSLSVKHPQIAWFDRDGDYKDTPQPSLGGDTPRAYLIAEGKRLTERHAGAMAVLVCDEIKRDSYSLVVVDDMRRLGELDVFRSLEAAYPDDYTVVHLHCDGGRDDFDTAKLAHLANWRISRGAALAVLPTPPKKQR